MNLPLVADISKDISRAYQVLVEDSSDDLYGAALRGLYIIDGNGTIRMAQINDAPVGRSVDETLRLVKAFQHTDKHGEVCPANWQPGSSTVRQILNCF
jgi:alkyl hydroperoxide reductase subunit AhpC